MPGAGIEPALPYGKGILSPPRLPFRHPGDDSLQVETEPDARTAFGSVSISRAGNGTRTRDPNLGKVVLYQLSYSRVRES